ncbi:unnamed protein product [Gongylonema pulchrum]|uniref:Uncharacterized protein n=1 Tax=Gongylonema pulchrum TaxID=637853 RepID=A0A183E1S9_9BILA|nr:unnamed protein product [Gongylonema pulchrum]
MFRKKLMEMPEATDHDSILSSGKPPPSAHLLFSSISMRRIGALQIRRESKLPSRCTWPAREQDPSVQQAAGQGATDTGEDFNPFAQNARPAPPRPPAAVNFFQ